MRCRILVSAVGALHKPVIPRIPGTATFAGIEGWMVPSSRPHPGPSWHTAQWEHTVPLQVTRPRTPPSRGREWASSGRPPLLCRWCPP